MKILKKNNLSPLRLIITVCLIIVFFNPLNLSAKKKYQRKKWGGWKKINKISVRHRVLAEESLEPVKWRGKFVILGKWKSPYTEATITNPRKLDIDHLVPVFEAWQSGGCLWTLKMKKAYYNNQTNQNHLVAVESRVNRVKSAKDLAEWVPQKNQKWYFQAWVDIKRGWNLSIDPREAKVIRELGISIEGLKIEPEEAQCK